MATLEELEEAMHAATAAAVVARVAYYDALRAALPIHVGDVVTVKSYKADWVGLVVDVDPWSPTSGFAKVAPRTKAGGWSKSPRTEPVRVLTKLEPGDPLHPSDTVHPVDQHDKGEG